MAIPKLPFPPGLAPIHQRSDLVMELTRFRRQFIALAIMKCFSKHYASNRILKVRAVRSAW